MDNLNKSYRNPHYRIKLHQITTSLLIILHIHLCSAEIKNAKVVEDSRPVIVFERFGFTKSGHLLISITDASFKPKHANAQFNSSLTGFFMVKESVYGPLMRRLAWFKEICVLSTEDVKVVLTCEDKRSSYNVSMDINEADEYNLVFANCQTEFHVTMSVRAEMYNIVEGEKDFLAAGQTLLPKMYFILFVVHSVFSVTWVVICFKQRQTLQKIHYIMGALLIFKTLKMICASEDFSYIRKTGTPHGWDVAFYVFGFLKGVTLFTVIILIGTGWSFLKPYLQERERNLLMFVIPLQVIENIASVVISESGPVKRDWVTWNEVFLIIDVVCCCAVFFPIIWSIRSLKEASKTDGKAAKNLEKLTIFRQFYIVVIAYMYFTRVALTVAGAFISYRYEWGLTATGEGVSFLLYLFIYINFQPVEKSPYLVIDNQGEALEELVVKEEQNSTET